MEYIKKSSFTVSSEDKEKINTLNLSFMQGEHDYLHGKTLPKKSKDEITALYRKYLSPLDNINWSGSLIEIELDDLKKDALCKNNSNKRYWVMSYMLTWVNELPEQLSIKDVFQLLDTRKALRKLYQYAYEEKA